MFPNAIIHWVFDNSSAHGSLAKDALTASKMNINPGGQVPAMHDTIIPTDNPAGRGGILQTMQFAAQLPEDDPFKMYEGLPKGMRLILQERGLFRPGMVGDCKTCKVERSRKPHINGIDAQELERIDKDEEYDTEDNEDARPADCCMRRLLSHQEDFLKEKSLLQQVRVTFELPRD